MKITAITRSIFIKNSSTRKKGILLIFLVLNSLAILASVDPPEITKTPNVATVCRGAALKVTLSGIPVSGCTCNYQQQYMLPGDASWSSMAVGSSIAPTSTGTAHIRARFQCSGSAGCDTSAWVSVSWTIVDLPTAPTAVSKFPNSDICIGTNVSATASGSTGGTGSCYYLYSFFHSGQTASAYTTNNTSSSDTATTLYVKARYYCTGYGCDTSNYNSTSWTVISDPMAPILGKNPNLDSVCIGAVATVNFVSNTGGTGTCADFFRYSDNGGVTWSSWSTTVPNVTVANIGQIVIIQGKKECDGYGCNPSDTSIVVWKGIADPVWSSISLSEDSLCVGGSVTMSATTTGGTGGNIDWYRYTNPPYTGLTQPQPTEILTSAKTYFYFPKYTPSLSNSGCNLDTGSNKKLVVVADPTWSNISATPSNDCVGAPISLSATLNNGLGGASINWIRDVISNGPGTTVSNPNTPDSADTYYYRPHYNPAANPRGCNLIDGLQRTVNIYPLPIAETITGTPLAGTYVCIGGIISATFSGGINALGSEENEYQYSTDNGVNWSLYTPGAAINANTFGTNIIQIRTRKIALETACISEWNIATWSVSPPISPPSLNIKNPNISAVCAGTIVNATITPGSGGNGCSDVIEYSTDNGNTWNIYNSGNPINTATSSEVIIRGWRGNCEPSSGCSNSATVEIARWSVISGVNTATLTPEGGQVCAGTPVSASINTPGSGGEGCNDLFQSRTRASGIWSAWSGYTPMSNITSTGSDSIQIRSIRNCEALSGCADTITYTWKVNNYTVTSPTLAKTPNVTTVCEGTMVSASLLMAGNGGNGCSDSYQYRTNNGVWGAWNNYALGNPIPTAGLIGVEIRTWRANCLPYGLCGDTTINTYSWTVAPQPGAPTITRDPLSPLVCNNEIIKGIITWDASGTGCSNNAQYRLKNGTDWANWATYNSGQNIFANGSTEIGIKAWTGNCNQNSGCIVPDTVFENWIVIPNLSNPTLNRIPNITSVCQEEVVSATLNSAGSGGINGVDFFEYRTNNGIWGPWIPYTLGADIPGTGLNQIEIKSYRKDTSSTCPPPAPNVISWSVVAPATPPSITKTPDLGEICPGTPVSAIIAPGSGGINCFDISEYRSFNGTIWSGWSNYPSGSSIFTTDKSIVQVRAFRACQPIAGCSSTDTAVVEWTIVNPVTHPTMNKIPNLDTICQGTSLAATIATAGSGGFNCPDITEYRLKIAGSWNSWAPYSPGNPIPTDLSTEGVEVKATHPNCSGGITCGTTPANIYSWVVAPLPIAPGIARIPDVDYLCSGQTARVSTTPGSGYSCSDYIEYRRFNGTTWSSWTTYPTGYNIPSAGYQTIEVRGFNKNCNISSGCTSDTNTVSWTVSPPAITPTLTKNPNTTAICEGMNISATISGGSGGIDCSDITEYSFDGITWTPYTSNAILSSIGVTSITIRTYRDNCNSLVPCSGSDTASVTWDVYEQPTSPTITRVPNTNNVCQGTSVNGNIVAGTGGAGCTDFYKYRTHNGTTWTAWNNYPLGFDISTTGKTQIEIMVYRTCTGTGCANDDTTTVHWDVDATIINPILLKTPNTPTIVETIDVYATIQTPGSNGNGCSDILQYRIDSGTGYGTWNPYNEADPIATSGLKSVQIRGYHGNCAGGNICPPADTALYTWNIVQKPQAPDITRNPNIDDVCDSSPISATINVNGGGVNCSDFAQYRAYNGTVWTTWSPYTSGNTITYPVGSTIVQVRAFRGDCLPISGDLSSDTTLASWNILETLSNPILLKSPSIAAVCQGTDVSATIQTPGKGGIGCSDILQSRVDSGSGFGAWTPYNAGDPVSTLGLTGVEIRGFAGNCSNGSQCPPTDTTIYSWVVATTPTAPLVTRIPLLDPICRGTSISATITAGTGGAGCTDTYESRTFNGTTWNAWAPYLSGANIAYAAIVTKVEVRAFRGQCASQSGCINTDTNSVLWTINEQPTNPILTKTPNTNSVCDGIPVSAAVSTPGTGGNGCTDAFDYRTFDGTTWSNWASYSPTMPIITTGISEVQIIGYRENCDTGNFCTPPLADTISWTIVTQPTLPTITKIPDVTSICSGEVLSATIIPGTGGASCTNSSEYRTFDGTTWSSWGSYTSGNDIAYAANIAQIEVRAYRANCNPASGCDIADTARANWLISRPIVNPIMAKEPNIAGVCDGTPVSATLTTPGDGGLVCVDYYLFRTNNGSGFSPWMPYSPSDAIPTNGLTEIEIQYGRGNCDPLNVCPTPAPLVLNWFVAPQPIAPSITRTPDIDSLCTGPILSGTITPGSGGAGCIDLYEYRLKDTLGLWSPWMPYVSDSSIQTDTIRGAQIKVSRTNCFEGSGCTELDPMQIEWMVFPQPIPPVLTRIPSLDAVCETTLLTAVQTGNTGGVPPTTIEYFHENPGEWSWASGNSFVPNDNGMAYIRAKASSEGYGCIDSEWEWVSWIVDPKPVVTPPASQTLCEGGSTQLDAIAEGGYGTYDFKWEMSTTSATGPWTPIPDSSRASLITGPLSNTTWYRIITTQQATSCFDVSNGIAVYIKPAPSVAISGNTIVCSGGTTLSATATNEPNPSTYQWQYSNSASGPWLITGSNSKTLTIPSVTGSRYFQCVVMGDTIGCTASSPATLVQLGTVPVISYHTADTNVCNGENLSLNIVAQALPAPTYQWHGPLGKIIGATSDTLHLNNMQTVDGGTYYCEVMSFCDTVISPTIQIGVLQNVATATTITGTTLRCQGPGFDLYTSDAQNALNSNWSMTPPEAGTINSKTGFASWSSTFAGTAQISVENLGCNGNTTISLTITVDSTVQTPTISGTMSRCQGVGFDQYVATSPGAKSFIWSLSNAGTSTIDPNTGLVAWDSTFKDTATIYAFANGCGGPSALGELKVSTIHSVHLTQSGSQHWCENDSKSLWVSPTPNNGNNFQWFDQMGEIAGATDSILAFSPVQAIHQGAYFCRVISLCGDTLFSNPDTISIHPLPEASFSISGTCRLDTIGYVNTSTVMDGSLSFQWMFGDGETSTNMNPSHIYLIADTFSVVLSATSSWGCSKSMSLPLIIHELPDALVSTIGDSCFQSGTGSIIITPTFGTPPFSYGIGNDPSQVDSIFTPLAAGNYFVTLTDSNGCKTTLPAIVTEPNGIKTHIYPNNVLCYNDSSGVADLEVSGGTEPYQYLWTNGQVSEDLTNVPIGNYGVSVMDANGCTAMDSVSLIQPNPIIVDSMVIQTTCLQLNDGKIFVFVSGGTGIYNYSWSTGSTLDSIVNLTPDTYQITVMDENGCKSIHQYQIDENNNDCITTWNTFSPDGDGSNDVWNIGHIDLYPECTVQIYNRWGGLVFESKGYQEPWDGTWNNKSLPAETYYFIINLGDGSDAISGTITIIR